MELDAYRNMADTEDGHWWFCGRRSIGEAVIRGLGLPDGASILEIGAGTGGNIAMLEKFGQVQAVEMSDLARRIAWEKTGSSASRTSPSG
jgi:protein-L-isoaspartate O-methyltransferase